VPPLRDALAIAAALIFLMAWDQGGGCPSRVSK